MRRLAPAIGITLVLLRLARISGGPRAACPGPDADGDRIDRERRPRLGQHGQPPAANRRAARAAAARRHADRGAHGRTTRPVLPGRARLGRQPRPAAGRIVRGFRVRRALHRHHHRHDADAHGGRGRRGDRTNRRRSLLARPRPRARDPPGWRQFQACVGRRAPDTPRRGALLHRRRNWPAAQALRHASSVSSRTPRSDTASACWATTRKSARRVSAAPSSPRTRCGPRPS